jgi:hypothetical protein
MNKFKTLALTVLAAIPLAGLAITAPASAAPTITPNVVTGQNLHICANGGAGLCLQNNGLNGSAVANDVNNSGTTQQYIAQHVTFTLHGAPPPAGVGTPFDNVFLNDSVASGRDVWQFTSVKSGNTLCLDVNGGNVDLNACSGSQSYWVATGSGRLASVGYSNATDALVFVTSNGTDGGHPMFDTVTNNNCPGACWGNF